MKRLPGLGLLNSGRTQAVLPSWGPDCPGCHLLPEDPWAGWGGFSSHQLRGQRAGRQGQLLHCQHVGWGRCPSVCVSGGKLCPRPAAVLTSGSLPSQLDEEEERRKRRREKNKVAAARCRNKKKERTEFLQRVSRAAGQGRERACARVDQVIKAVVSVRTWASAQATSTPLLFPAPCLIHPPEPRQTTCSSSASPGPWGPEKVRGAKCPPLRLDPWC